MDRLTTDEYSKVDKYWKLNRESRFDVERVKLFDYFDLNLKDKNVLEMAAGATGRISKFLHSKESNLTISDGRMVNINCVFHPPPPPKIPLHGSVISDMLMYAPSPNNKREHIQNVK